MSFCSSYKSYESIIYADEQTSNLWLVPHAYCPLQSNDEILTKWKHISIFVVVSLHKSLINYRSITFNNTQTTHWTHAKAKANNRKTNKPKNFLQTHYNKQVFNILKIIITLQFKVWTFLSLLNFNFFSLPIQ